MKEPDERTIEIPIITRGGKVGFFYGGPLPKLKEGQVGSIQIPALAFENPQDVTLLTVQETVSILPSGTELQVHMSQREDVMTLPEGLTRLRAINPVWGRGGYAQIRLEEDLRLTFRGAKKPLLEPCKCHVPWLGKSVDSLNQAYTRLSEKFEKHRLSNTGNVFAKVFYLPEKQTTWRSLDSLREQHQAVFEARVFQANDGLFRNADDSEKPNS